MIEALVGGVCTIIGAIIGGYIGKERGRTQSQEKIDKSLLLLQDELHERFGVKGQKVIASMKLLSPTGNVQVSRSYRGVLPGEGITVRHIPGTCWTSTPGSTISDGPSLSGVEDYDKAVSLRTEVVSDQQHKYRVEIEPFLSHEDKPLDFKVEVVYSAAILMNSTVLESAYSGAAFRYDYLSFDVEMPIDGLVLQVDFGKHSGFRAYPIVFHAWSEAVNDRELRRVREGFDKTTGVFEINEPCVGFRYAIYWEPPRG